MKLRLVLGLFFSGSVLCMKDVPLIMYDRFSELPDELITYMFEYDIDFTSVSLVNKRFNKLAKLNIKQIWQRLKKESSCKFVPEIIASIEESHGAELGYVHFIKLYKSLVSLLGRNASVKPEDIEIRNFGFLLNLDKDIQKLVELWPNLHSQIVRFAPYVAYTIIAQDSGAEEIGQWLSLASNWAAKNNTLLGVAGAGDSDMVNVLLKVGADVNCAHFIHSYTPLIFAVRHSHIDVVKLLVKENIDIDAVDWVSKTALIYAAENGNSEIVQILVEHGANIPEDLTRFCVRAREVLGQAKLGEGA